VCGRFTSSQQREAIGERFKVAVPESYQERFNLAPQQRALIVRERDDVRGALLVKWGLLPHSAKDAKIALKMINARAETLAEKPAYRGLLSNRRCLIRLTASTSGRSGVTGKSSRSTSTCLITSCSPSRASGRCGRMRRLER
jgi:putative SOS response-associated peptidase YedK